MEQWDRVNEDRRLQKERRRFLVLIVFDVAFVFLMWLIYTVSKGKNWTVIFHHEIDVNNPRFFEESLFDVVVAAVCRVVWAMYFYCLFRVAHWFPVAVATIASTVFLIAKSVFYFKARQVFIPELMVVLGSFTMAWIELWLSPIRHSTSQAQDEQPIIRVRRTNRAAEVTDDDFRSAIDDSSDSSDESINRSSRADRSTGNRVISAVAPFQQLSDQQYTDLGRSSMAQGKRWYGCVADWQVVSKQPHIRCSYVPMFSKVYFLQVECPTTTAALWKILYTDDEMSPLWNKTVLHAKCLSVINASTSLVYAVAAPALLGYIAARDFIDVRYIKIDEAAGRYEMSTQSTQTSIALPVLSNQPKLVRGENGPNYWVIRPSEQRQGYSIFEWIMNTDLKGGLPRSLVDRGTTSFLTQYAKALAKHCTDLNAALP